MPRQRHRCSARRAGGRCRPTSRRRRRRRPSRSAARRCARSRRAHRDRCRRVPVFGHAVQAPIVIAPKAVPRVSANCVSPRPNSAATANENRNPIKQAHVSGFRRRQLPRAPLSADATALGVCNRGASLRLPMRRQARAPQFSIMRSTRSSTSIERLVSMVGRCCAGSLLAARGRDLRRGRRRAGRNARNVLHLDALMRIGHDLLPGHAGQRAAGHAVGRRVVVIAVPDAGNIVAGVADEPGVAIRVGGAGLAGRLDALEDGALAGAFLDRPCS